MQIVLYKRFTPAGPDHAQIAASAGIADYIDDVYSHHSSLNGGALERGEFVHDLFRDHEDEFTSTFIGLFGLKEFN